MEYTDFFPSIILPWLMTGEESEDSGPPRKEIFWKWEKKKEEKSENRADT